MKRLISLMLILVLALSLCGCGRKNTVNVSVLIDISAVEENYLGALSAGTLAVVEIPENGTVMDALKAYCEKSNLELSLDGTGSDAFVTGIGDIYMGDFAEVDGWVYTVNGEEIWEGADVHTLNDGDNVVWSFMVW